MAVATKNEDNNSNLSAAGRSAKTQDTLAQQVDFITNTDSLP